MNYNYPLFFEEWLPLTIYNLRDGYYISNAGRIYDLNRNVFIKPCYTQDGYHQVTLRCKDGSRKNVRINRAVLLTFNPIVNSEDMEVNHIDCCRDNNCLYNLDWMTKSQNNAYCYKVGTRTNIGENNPNSKLNEDDVIMIHELNKMGLSTTEIMKEFGFESHSNRVMINRVLRGETWKYIYDKYNDN